jgi:hypothetical protein
VRLVGAIGLALATACGERSGSSREVPKEVAVKEVAAADSMGVFATDTATLGTMARHDVDEASGAALSATQGGVLFTINDSGNEPLLYALDTTGADRGAWRVRGARNVDWEAVSVGPCGAPDASGTDGAASSCVYIGDVGDNTAERVTRSIYRVPEPAAEGAGFTGSTGRAQQLVYRYSDGPRNVEAMYVAPDGGIFLIMKNTPRRIAARGRRARVYHLSPSAWDGPSPATAQLVDSLPIVPGSALGRQITDAALSPDGRHVAVRTYSQVFIFATDSATGRIDSARAPAVCNISDFLEVGEGIAWLETSGALVLTNEGRSAPIFRVSCPLP